MGGEQAHKRMVASLEKQIAVQEKKLEQVSVFCCFKEKKKTVQRCLHFYLLVNTFITEFNVLLIFCPLFQVQEKHNKLQETLSEAEEQLSQVSEMQ